MIVGDVPRPARSCQGEQVRALSAVHEASTFGVYSRTLAQGSTLTSEPLEELWADWRLQSDEGGDGCPYCLDWLRSRRNLRGVHVLRGLQAFRDESKNRSQAD